MHPPWNHYFGSGGRAAAALAALERRVALHSYADADVRAAFEMRAAMDDMEIELAHVALSPSFQYVHGLSVPEIRGRPGVPCASLTVEAQNVLRFGMIEGDAIVQARRVVYDPQDARQPALFHANGSTAEELALVLPLSEQVKAFSARVGYDVEPASEPASRIDPETGEIIEPLA